MRIIVLTVLVSLLVLGLAGAAPTQDVHKDCTKCHVDPDKDIKAVKKGMNEICLECHPGSRGKDHPIGLVTKIQPPGLPLDEGNRIGCVTCHEPHGRETSGGLLRMEFNRLCRSCHTGR